MKFKCLGHCRGEGMVWGAGAGLLVGTLIGDLSICLAIGAAVGLVVEELFRRNPDEATIRRPGD